MFSLLGNIFRTGDLSLLLDVRMNVYDRCSLGGIRGYVFCFICFVLVLFFDF